MSWYILIPTLAFILNAFVWGYVLGQRQHDPVSRSFITVSTATAGWIAGDFLLLTTFADGREIAIIKAQSVFWIPMGFWFMSFAYALAEKKPDARFVIGTMLSVVGVIFFLFTDWGVKSFSHREWGVSVSMRPVPFFIYTCLDVFFGIAALWIIHRTRRTSKDPEIKSTLTLIMAGGGLATLLVTTLNVFLPELFGVTSIPRFGSSALVVFILIVFWAVSKHRFLAISADKVAEALFEEIDDGIVIIDRFGKIQRTNPRAARLLSEPSAGETLKQLFAKGTDKKVIRLNASNGDFIVGEKILSVSVSDASHLNERIGRIAILRDISEQKHAEDILRESKEALEKEVEKRVLELRHAQKMEAMGTLAGGIAHDFNNILAAISGFTHAALQELPTVHPVRNDLNEVIIASGRAREIVQQILTFSRRPHENQYRTVSVREILDEVMALLSLAVPSTVRMECDFEADGGALHCDSTQISQVMMNLVANAVQAMRKRSDGVLRIAVSRVVLDEGFVKRYDTIEIGEHVCISFEDNGAGISDDNLQHVFDPFFTTRKQSDGTGLGLCTALEIIRNHGGTVTAESEEGKGARFSVYLPLFDETDEVVSASERVIGGTEHIMVVDDEVPLQKVARRLLEPLGYRITTFSNGAEALAWFTASGADIDLVITDQTMPQMTGLRLAEQLLTLRPSLPVILLSGYGARVSRTAIDAAGIRAFFNKPVPRNLLPITIRSLLDERGDPSDGSTKE